MTKQEVGDRILQQAFYLTLSDILFPLFLNLKKKGFKTVDEEGCYLVLTFYRNLELYFVSHFLFLTFPHKT